MRKPSVRRVRDSRWCYTASHERRRRAQRCWLRCGSRFGALGGWVGFLCEWRGVSLISPRAAKKAAGGLGGLYPPRSHHPIREAYIREPWATLDLPEGARTNLPQQQEPSQPSVGSGRGAAPCLSSDRLLPRTLCGLSCLLYDGPTKICRNGGFDAHGCFPLADRGCDASVAATRRHHAPLGEPA